MPNWWTIRQLSKMRQAEMLKEAERYRMTRKGQAKNPKFHGVFPLLLGELGELLVHWGSFLQRRYGARIRNPIPQPRFGPRGRA